MSMIPFAQIGQLLQWQLLVAMDLALADRLTANQLQAFLVDTLRLEGGQILADIERIGLQLHHTKSQIHNRFA